MMRGMQVEIGKTRPQTLMTGHSGYITSARRKVKRENDNATKSFGI
jgi:tRNA A58 N-methylase Trm61